MKQPGFLQSLTYAWSGLVVTFRTQRNARIHTIVGFLVLAAAAFLRLEWLQAGVLVLTIGAVLAAETINTTVEAIVDLLSPEWHQRAKVAKDTSAAAVLIMSLTAIVVGMLILGPPLWARIAGG